MELRKNRLPPGRYREEEVSTTSPSSHSPIFIHPRIPYNPNLPEACFPTVLPHECPPLNRGTRSSERTDEEQRRDDAEAAKFEQDMSQFIGPGDPWEENINSFSSLQSSDDTSDDEEPTGLYDCTDPETGYSSSPAVWDDLTDGMKLIIMRELTNKISFELASSYLCLGPQEKLELVNISKREAKLNREEDAKIAAVNKAQLNLLMKGDYTVDKTEYTAIANKLDGFETHAAMFISKGDIKKAVSFLRHVYCKEESRRRSCYYQTDPIKTHSLSPSRLIHALIRCIWMYEGVEITRANIIIRPKRKAFATNSHRGPAVEHAARALLHKSPETTADRTIRVDTSQPDKCGISQKLIGSQINRNSIQNLTHGSPDINYPSAINVTCPTSTGGAENIENRSLGQKRVRFVLDPRNEEPSPWHPSPRRSPSNHPPGPSSLRNCLTAADLELNSDKSTPSAAKNEGMLPVLAVPPLQDPVQVACNPDPDRSLLERNVLMRLNPRSPKKFPPATVSHSPSRVIVSPPSTDKRSDDSFMDTAQYTNGIPPSQPPEKRETQIIRRPLTFQRDYLPSGGMLIPVKNLAGQQIGRSQQHRHWTGDSPFERIVYVDSNGIRQVQNQNALPRSYSEFWTEHTKLMSSDLRGGRSSEISSCATVSVNSPTSDRVDGATPVDNGGMTSPKPPTSPIKDSVAFQCGNQQSSSSRDCIPTVPYVKTEITNTQHFPPFDDTLTKGSVTVATDHGAITHPKTNAGFSSIASSQTTFVPQCRLPIRSKNTFSSRGRGYLENTPPLHNSQVAFSVTQLPGTSTEYVSPYGSSNHLLYGNSNARITGSLCESKKVKQRENSENEPYTLSSATASTDQVVGEHLDGPPRKKIRAGSI